MEGFLKLSLWLSNLGIGGRVGHLCYSKY
jgi:hypothetical protein